MKVPGCASLMTLLSVMAYHSFSGEVEASNTPTIRRLTPSCRHQLPRIARKAPLDVMMLQYENYRAQGFPDSSGIIPEGGVIVRRHHQAHVRAAMEQWWSELLKHSARDQISLSYVIWRNSMTFTLLDWDLRTAPWFTYRDHA